MRILGAHSAFNNLCIYIQVAFNGTLLDFVERRMRHGIRMTHTKTLVAGLYQTSALPSLAAFGSGGPVGASACAVAYVRRSRGVIGRVDYGAIDGRGMYIRVVSSATWNSHTRAHMHSSQITEIQQYECGRAAIKYVG